MRQTDTSGDARWFSRTNIGNQVVSARVRPMSFGTTTGTQDPWVGIAAQVKDAQNYYYMTTAPLESAFVAQGDQWKRPGDRDRPAAGDHRHLV